MTIRYFFAAFFFISLSVWAGPDELTKIKSILAAKPEVEKILFTTNKYEGPNCFGSALAFSGMANLFTEATAEELRHALQSVYCNPVSAENLMFGDLLVLLKDQHYFHAFTYLNSKYGFTKNGNSSGTIYEIQPIAQTLSIYTDPYLGECEDCKGKRGSEECSFCFAPVSVQGYRCSKPGTPPVELQGFQNRVLLLDTFASGLLFGTGKTSVSELSDLMPELLKLWLDLSNQKKSYWSVRLQLQLSRIAEELSTVFRLIGGNPNLDDFYLIRRD